MPLPTAPRLALALLAALSAVPAATLYVAPDGNDAWSGKLAKPNAGRTDGPVATLARARDLARAARAAGPVTVQLRGGRYELAEPVRFTPADSGTAAAPVTFEAYPGETPVLSGGRRLTGGRPVDGHVLAFDLPEVKAGRWYFRSLFADGVRLIRARHPNVDPSDPYRTGFLYAAAPPGSFAKAVGNIHNVGDTLTYRLKVPADGDYAVWVLYGALNKPFGNDDMGGRTALRVDGGEPVPLLHLPDTGGWNSCRWSRCALLSLKAGERQLEWRNEKGGGLNLQGFALSDDPAWEASPTASFQPAAGRHLVTFGAADFVSSKGPQISVGAVSDTSLGNKAFRCRPGDFPAAWAREPGAEVHIFQSANCRAFLELCSLDGVDETTGLVKIGGPEASSGIGTGDRYWLENVRAALDSPGEWYLDRAAGVLYVWPPKPGVSLVAPVVSRLIEVIGDPKGQPVTDLRFRGLTFRETDWSPDDGYVGYQTGADGVIRLEQARRCEVSDCRFTYLGKPGVCLTGGGEHRVLGNEVAHSAEGGLLVLDSAGNQVADNHLHHLGEVYKHVGGVVLSGAQASDNVLEHNWVHDSSRYGISCKDAGSRNRIEWNRVERTNLETFDTGGIEVTQGNREGRSGSVIAHNLVADTIGYSSIRETPVYLSWGIYLDSFAGGYDVHHNLVYRSNDGGIMLQGGKDNHVWNNVFVGGTRYQGYLSNFANNSTGLVVERNIFAWTAKDAVLFTTGKLGPDVIRLDHNLYSPPAGQSARVLSGGFKDFAAWQALGFDANSKVADPQFVDPAHDDYRLKPGSPAFALGFEAIDVSKVGPRKR